jgi:hypothetical protein
MASTFWQQVQANGLEVPTGRPLAELTAELTGMLGDPDPAVRDGLAYPTLATWVRHGVYDQLLEGLGDGMASGLAVGLGETRTDTVFRRSFSALVLADCIDRDNEAHLVPADTVVRWGDRLASWLVRERDLRGYVPGKGWAHAVAHGADALGVLAGSEAMSRLELTVVLDVIADRVLLPCESPMACGEDDRLAHAAMRVLRRNLLPLDVLEPWVARLAHSARPASLDDCDPYLLSGNAQRFLRALHLQLALAPDPPEARADLLLVLIDRLKETNPEHLGAPARG